MLNAQKACRRKGGPLDENHPCPPAAPALPLVGTQLPRLTVTCRCRHCRNWAQGKKKKKKKAKARELEGLEDLGENEGPEGEGERKAGGLPWEGSDRDYTYEELLGEAQRLRGAWLESMVERG